LVGEDRKVEILAKAEFAKPWWERQGPGRLKHDQEGIREGKLTGKSHYGLFLRNTGIAYAMIGAALGYQVELVIPENAGKSGGSPKPTGLGSS